MSACQDWNPYSFTLVKDCAVCLEILGESARRNRSVPFQSHHPAVLRTSQWKGKLTQGAIKASMIISLLFLCNLSTMVIRRVFFSFAIFFFSFVIHNITKSELWETVKDHTVSTSDLGLNVVEGTIPMMQKTLEQPPWLSSICPMSSCVSWESPARKRNVSGKKQWD